LNYLFQKDEFIAGFLLHFPLDQTGCNFFGFVAASLYSARFGYRIDNRTFVLYDVRDVRSL